MQRGKRQIGETHKQALNPRVFELAHYTLRETDVNPTAEEAKKQGKCIMDCRLGDPIVFGLFTYPRYRRYVVEAWDDPKTYRYGDACGLPELREILARGNVEFGTKGYALPPHHVFIGSGISGVARGLLTTLINPMNGDEVVIPKWSYIIYLAESALSGAVVRNVDLTSAGIVDLAKLEGSINAKTKAVFITTVGNPLGVAMAPETFVQIIDMVNRKEREFNHPIYLIADTIYEDFRVGPPLDPIQLSIQHGRIGPTIELYSISKMISAPGLRLGWMRVFHNEDGFPDDVHAFCEGYTIGRQPSLGPASTASQLALIKLYSGLDDGEHRREFDDFRSDRRNTVRSRVQATLEALSRVENVVFPQYYYADGTLNLDVLNSFYILLGVDHAICPRSEFSQARRMADYHLQNFETVLLATPGDHFLAHEFRGHTQKQEYMRIVALSDDPKSIADGVRRFAESLKK